MHRGQWKPPPSQHKLPEIPESDGLDLFAGNELVTADHTSGMNVNVRIDFFTGGDSDLGEMLICNKFPAA